MLDYFQFSSGGLRAGTCVADYCKFLKGHEIVNVGNTGLGKEIVFRDRNWTRELTIDTANGFCPVAYTAVSQDKPPGVSNAITKWRRVSDVWVPKSLFIRQFYPDGGLMKYSLEYEWEGVNKPVDASYFDHKSFPDIPEDVRVTDTRPDDDDE